MSFECFISTQPPYRHVTEIIYPFTKVLHGVWSTTAHLTFLRIIMPAPFSYPQKSVCSAELFVKNFRLRSRPRLIYKWTLLLMTFLHIVDHFELCQICRVRPNDCSKMLTVLLVFRVHFHLHLSSQEWVSHDNRIRVHFSALILFRFEGYL